MTKHGSLLSNKYVCNCNRKTQRTTVALKGKTKLCMKPWILRQVITRITLFIYSLFLGEGRVRKIDVVSWKCTIEWAWGRTSLSVGRHALIALYVTTKQARVRRKLKTCFMVFTDSNVSSAYSELGKMLLYQIDYFKWCTCVTLRPPSGYPEWWLAKLWKQEFLNFLATHSGVVHLFTGFLPLERIGSKSCKDKQSKLKSPMTRVLWCLNDWRKVTIKALSCKILNQNITFQMKNNSWGIFEILLDGSVSLYYVFLSCQMWQFNQKLSILNQQ